MGFPAGAGDRARIATLGPAGIEVADLAVRSIPVGEALPGLLSLPVDDRPSYRRPPDSVRAWALAARLAVRAVAGCRVVPDLVLSPDGSGLHGVWRRWHADSPEDETVLGWLAAAMPRSGHALAHDEVEAAVWDPAALLSAFIDAVADLAVRSSSSAPAGSRPRERLLPWTARWAEALSDPADPRVPMREDPAEVVASIAGWQAAASATAGREAPELRLQAPDDQDGVWVLDLGLRTPDGASLPAADVWAGEDPARQEALLRGLGRCARVFPPIDVALREPTPMRAELSLEQAWTFLTEAAPALERVGAVVVLPDHLSHDGLRVRLRVDAPEPEADDTSGQAPADGLEGQLADVSWEVALGGQPLSSEELDTLLGAASPLVRWRDRWVQVDEGQLRAVRDRTGSGRSTTLPLAEALALGLAGSTAADPAERVAADDVEVVAGGGVARLLDMLAEAAEAPPEAGTPAGFVGELRPYQRRGVAWLKGMGTLGLGAVLADDMGLGKGIQLIAYLLTRPAGPHLVVCPTSVVGNWERELARFAPSLAVTRFHGPDRPSDLRGVTGVVVTSYGTMRRDAEPLTAVDWHVVALDEAQHVKNPTTAGARVVRRLGSRQTLALTGTPLENRLSELWALLDVTNRGLLGSRAAFGRRFVVPIEKRRDGRAAARLRRLVAPFILRREKSDPSVIAELPPKIERTVVCPLTSEQATLYRAVVDRAFGQSTDSLAQGGAASAMSRRGRVLALLTALKQVCNHPAQYLPGESTEPPGVEQLAGRSGKLAAAREIIAEAVEAGDRVLVFTQYVAMGHLLVTQLATDLDVDVPFLHGGVSAPARDRMVAAFQGEGDGRPPPVLVVSLRAGGTGLNLTAATHVVHYDRWWNPAVEDQATDRAHRIGQHRTVEVHKLVTAGTVEERIAAIIERKRALSEHVVGAGESWITELGDDELADLVALSPEASIDDLDDDWQPLTAPGMEEAS